MWTHPITSTGYTFDSFAMYFFPREKYPHREFARLYIFSYTMFTFTQTQTQTQIHPSFSQRSFIFGPNTIIFNTFSTKCSNAQKMMDFLFGKENRKNMRFLFKCLNFFGAKYFELLLVGKPLLLLLLLLLYYIEFYE